jgi:hypothetical protein
MMKRTELATRKLTLILAAALLVACGPKKPPEDAAGKAGDKGTSSQTEEDQSLLATLVERLNKAIDEGNEAEAGAILEEQTRDMLVEIMMVVPEWEPAGDDVALVDYLDWEKENGIRYELVEEDAESGTGTIMAQINELDEFEGDVSVVGEGDEAQLEFLDFASERRDEVLSQNIAREKFLVIVENINKAIEGLDAKMFQDSVTNDTINNEVKLYSYYTKKKSNLSPKGLVKMMKKEGYFFSASKINAQTGDAMLKVVDGDDNVVLEGPMKFRSEIGKMRLDYADLLQTRIDEEQAAIDEKKSKKSKKKGK